MTELVLRVFVFGEPSTGKTALIQRLSAVGGDSAPQQPESPRAHSPGRTRGAARVLCDNMRLLMRFTEHSWPERLDVASLRKASLLLFCIDSTRDSAHMPALEAHATDVRRKGFSGAGVVVSTKADVGDVATSETSRFLADGVGLGFARVSAVDGSGCDALLAQLGLLWVTSAQGQKYLRYGTLPSGESPRTIIVSSSVSASSSSSSSSLAVLPRHQPISASGSGGSASGAAGRRLVSVSSSSGSAGAGPGAVELGQVAVVAPSGAGASTNDDDDAEQRRKGCILC